MALAPLLQPQFLIPFAVALGSTGAAWLLWRALDHRSIIPGPVELGMSIPRYERLLSWMPLALGAHAAVPLLVSGTQRQLFVPSIPLEWDLLGGVLGLAQIVVALSFIYGALTRLSAVALVGLWLAAMIVADPLEALELSFFVGIAFVLFAAGRGPLAFDAATHRLGRPLTELVPRSITVLRVLTGIAIAVTAYTEKLGNVEMGVAFLQQYPFNFLPAIGLEVSDAMFILLAGTVELTFGLLLISGAFIRLTILILWLPFNLTLPFLGWVELVGHLPIYGVMALLLVSRAREPETGEAMVRGLERSRDLSADDDQLTAGR